MFGDGKQAQPPDDAGKFAGEVANITSRWRRRGPEGRGELSRQARHRYPGALHSFTNPDADEYARKFNMPVAYHAEAGKDSWERLRGFLAGILKP